MKKLALILTVTAIGILMLASSAFALQSPYTHGNFASNSKGCGDCHTTHSAGAPKLLNTTSSYQTSFCIGCHGKQSPFDVLYGQIVKDTGDDPDQPLLINRWDWSGSDATQTGGFTSFSYSGGFLNAFNFDVDDNTNTIATQVYSVHNVRGLTEKSNITDVTEGNWDEDFDTLDTVNNLIPGGTNEINFECGSCHDPHKGGPYNTGNWDSKNARLLKEDIFDRTDMRVKMDINADNMVVEYVYGFNTWCGACHDVFDTSIGGTGMGGWRSGNDKATIARDKYMHKFGVTINTGAGNYPAGLTNGTPFQVEYLALETTNKISCITCHRAHGSSAPVSGQTWKRYATYKDGSGSETDTGSGSALLRLPNRDVCYDCHGAAEWNHNQTH